nr:twin-arginine translocation signal domain-containing protein [Microbacterium sp. KUDC0406]
MTPPLDISRRQFLTASAVTAGAALLAGCSPPPPPPVLRRCSSGICSPAVTA